MSDEHTTIAEARRWLAEFVAARDWQSYHDPKNLAMSIAIEAAELMEHFQWLRSDELAEHARDPAQRQLIVDELADVLCYCLALANTLDVDVAASVREKLAKNAAKYPVERFRGRYHKPRDV
ncbi:MAG: nucleotide pyrophosphohydrolase [Phycisphaerae bacterium]